MIGQEKVSGGSRVRGRAANKEYRAISGETVMLAGLLKKTEHCHVIAKNPHATLSRVATFGYFSGSRPASADGTKEVEVNRAFESAAELIGRKGLEEKNRRGRIVGFHTPTVALHPEGSKRLEQTSVTHRARVCSGP